MGHSHRLGSILALAGLSLFASCSRGLQGAKRPNSDSGAGGTTGIGGRVTASEGTGGAMGAGGATAGDASVGAGGVAGSDGPLPTGGASGTGGGPARGGATGTGGGSATGGVVGTGGVVAAGGRTGAGGALSTGGTTGTGGGTGGRGGSGTGGSTECTPLPAAPTGTTDAVAGTLITFNDNGAWSWHQDERAIVDVKAGKLVIGSVAGGGGRTGNIEAVIYDLATGASSGPAKLGKLSVDDHDAPALNIRPDGKYVAVWATHRTDCNTYYSIYDGLAWAAQKTFDWKSEGCPWDGDSTHMITYSNVWYMGPALFDIARSVGTSPNLLASTDDGETWSYYGRLTYTPLTGYVAGYYKYWGNNTDRIDFVGTEAHPRDYDNNLWHGYMQGGKIYDSAATVVDDALAGTSAATSAQTVDKFTKVFATGSTLNGLKLDHAWSHDIVRYADGTIAILGQARVTNTGTDDPDKRMLYFRFDGTSWQGTYLVKGGPKLYADEQDYTGLAALHPDNPNIIYVSTTYDPRDDRTMSSKHEIYAGVTCDNGATFKWTPVTQGSTQDNICPIVPKWDASHTALLWMKGRIGASAFTTSVVGIITSL
jgi:hypothetical protein